MNTGYLAPAAPAYTDEEEEEPLPTYNRANNGGGSSYVAPAPSSAGYGAPADDSYGAPADDSYGAPADDSYGAPADDSYGAPAGDSYGAPAGDSYGAPAGDSYGAPAGDSYGAPADDSYGAPAEEPLSGGYDDPSADLLPEYFKSEINLGLNDPEDVPRIEPFLADYGSARSAPTASHAAAASEPDLSYGVPAAPAISLANYNIAEISNKGYLSPRGSAGYGR